jgi:hypothetical protein
MKKIILSILLAVMLPIVTIVAGCSTSIENRAIDSFKKTFDNYKAGIYDEEEMAEIFEVFEELGLTPEANQNLTQTFKNLFGKISY